jgi:hypothetical protein
MIRGSENPVMGLLAGPGETRILVTSKAWDEAEAERLAAPIVSEVIRRLGPNYVGRDGQTLVASACERLKRRSLRLGVADSVTSGEAALPYLKRLGPENLAGALAVGGESLDRAVDYLFRTLGADLVGVIGRPGPDTPSPDDPNPDLEVTARLLGRGPSGGDPVEISSDRRLAGRARAMAMTRAGAMMAIQLWNYLKGLDQD